jgi:hypothetical protein
MRKLMISILLFATFFGCDKELGSLKYLETIPGGCASDKGSSLKSAQIWRNDTVSYSISDGNLDLFVGFNATCCGQYNTSSEIKGDTIFVEILTTQIGLCNCICYYTYNFKFSGSGDSYNYHINIDDYLVFTGHIKS